MFLHIISLFSAVTAFNKRDTYRCSQRSKVNWFICSLLGHYHTLTATELKRKPVSVHIDIACKMYRSILSPAPMCWTLVLVLLQHFFCIHFRNAEIHAAVWQRWRQLADPVSRLRQRFKVFAQHFSGGRWAREESQVLRDPSFSHWFGVFPAVLLEIEVSSSWLGQELVWSCRNY